MPIRSLLLILLLSTSFSSGILAAETDSSLEQVRRSSETVQPVAKDTKDLGFMDTYFPFEMDDYAPAVDETSTKVGTWAGSILCFPLVGWGVGELLMLGDKAPLKAML